MRILLFIMMLGMAAGNCGGMESPPRSAKRRLEFSPVASPTQEGYGTEPATTPGTPEITQKRKIQMGLSKISIINLTRTPALIAFRGSTRQVHTLLKRFESADKREAVRVVDVNLVLEPLYISAYPNLFNVSLHKTANQIVVAQADMYAEPDQFRIVNTLEYRPSEPLTIRIMQEHPASLLKLSYDE